jgi:hydrogenase nickel incorporation protein HypB
MATEYSVRERMNVGASALNRELFTSQGVFVVSLFGAPSCGKTSLIEATLQRLAGKVRVGVLVGSIRALQDAEHLRKTSSLIYPIETIDLTAELVREALQHIDLSQLDLLLVERAGSGFNPSPGCEDLGQAAKVGLFSVTGGDENIGRYQERIENSDVLLLTKSDLLPFQPFDLNLFRHEVRRVNPGSTVIPVSVLTGQGLDKWCMWLRTHANTWTARENDRLD